MTTTTKTCVRWPGSKTTMAPQIVQLLGLHQTYVEPYFGSGAVLFAKPRSRDEIVNDLDGEIINFFQVLRSDTDALITALTLTPCAQDELADARRPYDNPDPVERARQFFTRTNLSYGGSTNGGFVANYGGGEGVATKWTRQLGRLAPVAERLQGIQILNRDALEVLEKATKHENTAIYLDPPYLEETLSRDHYFEWEGHLDDHHVTMLELALRAKGTVVISGYASDLYDTALDGWNRIELKSNHNGNVQLERSRGRVKRTEVLWANRTELALPAAA